MIRRGFSLGGIMKASSLSFQAGVTLVVVGMIWGLQMAISKDHAAMPAHAHLNLLGFVSLFLFGFYYRLHPSLDRSRAALIQVSIWIAGTVVMAIGVGLVHTGREAGDPLAAIGSLAVLAAMLMFGWQVYRCERGLAGERSAIMPAE
jgi:peptidoglycan/LPS O-acetylase OafA/YrhL